MPIVELEFRIRNAREAVQSQEALDKALKETEKSATGSARAVARLEREYQAGFRTAENYRKELARVSKEARDGSDAQVAALRRMAAEEQRLAQQRKRHAAEQERLAQQQKANSFSNQFGVGLGSSRLNLGVLSPLMSSFGGSPGQFTGAALGTVGGMAISGINRGLSSVGGGVLGFITSAGQSAISTLEDLGRTAIQTGLSLATGLVKNAFEGAVQLDSLTRGLSTISKNADDLRHKLSVSREIARLPGIGFEEGVQAKLQLESAGASDALATRAVMEFGNALASVGKGKEDLKEVNNQLSQMLQAGKATGEDIKTISQRVPQFRRALAAAFGTTDTAKINKMGMPAVQMIEKLVAELEKLPRVSGGLRNLLDNLSDDAKFALQPLGQGAGIFAEGLLSGTGPGFSKIAELLRGAGEVLAAIGKSGVAAEAIGKALEPLVGTNVNDFEDALATGAAAISAAMKQVPLAFSIASDYAAIIKENIVTGWKYALLVAPLVKELITGTFKAITSSLFGPSQAQQDAQKKDLLKRAKAGEFNGGQSDYVQSGLGFSFDGFMKALGGSPSDQFGPFFWIKLLTSGDFGGAVNSGIGAVLLQGADQALDQKKGGVRLGDRFKSLFDQFPNFKSLSLEDNPELAKKWETLLGNPDKKIVGSFESTFASDKARILAARSALPDLPDALTFGGNQVNGKGQSNQSALEKLLNRLEGIERKGRLGGADFLRGITTGEIDNPAFMVTGSEMNRAGARGQYLEPQHYATGLEQEITRIILQIQRQNGAGTPALGGF